MPSSVPAKPYEPTKVVSVSIVIFEVFFLSFRLLRLSSSDSLPVRFSSCEAVFLCIHLSVRLSYCKIFRSSMWGCFHLGPSFSEVFFLHYGVWAGVYILLRSWIFFHPNTNIIPQIENASWTALTPLMLLFIAFLSYNFLISKKKREGK